jgi:hypothetical protein
MEWFAAYSSGILRGSMSNADDTTQIIWIKYMAMANEAHDPYSGRLEFKKGDPYPIDYLAMQCRKNRDEILLAEKEFMADINKSDGVTPRLTIEPDGTRVLSNWINKQNRKDTKPKSLVKATDPQSEAPLTLDEKKQKQEIAATELAYKFPDRAKKGIERRDFDNSIKPRTE